MLKSLHVENFRSLKNVVVDFPAEVILLEGQNGSGKSSLLEAVIFALYGVNPVKREDLLHSEAVGGTLSVALEFEARGNPYRVERTSRPAKNESQAYLWLGEERIARGWKAVTEAVSDIFMPYEFFRLTCYAPQNELAAFASMAPEERRKTLSRYLGVEQVNDAVKQLRQDLREEEAALEALAAYLTVSEEELEHVVAIYSKTKGAAEKELAKAEKELGKTEKLLEKIREQIRRADRVTVQYDQALGHYEEIDSQGQELAKTIAAQKKSLKGGDREKLSEEIRRLEKLLPDISRRDGLMSELETVETEIEELSTEWVEKDWDAELKEVKAALGAATKTEGSLRTGLEEKLLKLGGNQLRGKLKDTNTCPVCASPLSVEARESLVSQAAAEGKRLAEEVQALQDRLRGVSEDKTAAEQRVAEINANKKEQATLIKNKEKAEKRRAQLTKALAALPKDDFTQTQTTLSTLRQQVDALTTLAGDERELARLRKALGVAAGALEKAEEALEALPQGLGELEKEQGRLSGEKASRQNTVDTARGALAAADRELSQAERDLDAYRRVKADVHKRQGVVKNLQTLEQELKSFRKYLLEKARPSVSKTASQLLAEISEGRYLSLSLAEDFSITVVDSFGRMLGYDTLSGGEKDLVSLCLRLAFPKVQAASFLLLDEVFGSQDAERQINIIQALLRIREHFPQILLTTHTREAKEYAEAVLQFVWDGGETKVGWAAA